VNFVTVVPLGVERIFRIFPQATDQNDFVDHVFSFKF